MRRSLAGVTTAVVASALAISGTGVAHAADGDGELVVTVVEDKNLDTARDAGESSWVSFLLRSLPGKGKRG